MTKNSVMDRPEVSTPRSLHTSQKHQEPSANHPTDMPVITHPSPRTKAELAALQFVPGDALDQEKHIFTFSCPYVLVAGFVAGALAFGDAIDAVVTGYLIATAVTGHQPTPSPFEDLLAKQVRDIGPNASVTQLLEARSRLLAERSRGTSVAYSLDNEE